MARRLFDGDSEESLSFDGEPALEAGDHVFVHETSRNHLVWQVTRAGRPLVLIEGAFRALPRDEYLPLAGG
jgi:hypothetical protein